MDESIFADNKTATAKEGTYHQQPNLRALPSLPNPAHTTPSTKSDLDTNSLHDSRSSDTFNLSKALDFDADSLFPQSAKSETEHTEALLAAPPTDQTKRSIQIPHEARRARRSPSGSLSAQSLVPLPLGPVVLRDPHDLTQTMSQPAFTPDYANAKPRHRRSESTQDQLSHSAYPSYLETRETPYQRCTRQSTETLALRSIPSDPTKSPPPTYKPSTTPKSSLSTPSLSNSFKHHARELNSSVTSVTQNDRPRTGARLQRKRSNQSHHPHSNAGDSDVEKEVLELNTIVEERRAETNTARSRYSHIPAVAPSMQIRARSETLNDIGSALSRPLTTQTEPRAEDPTTRQKPKASNSLVPGWLSNVTKSPSLRKQNAPVDETLHSRAETSPHPLITSASSSITALSSASASYTLESSSPTLSKRYSRSLMITPLPSVEDGVGYDGPKQVGVAL